MRFQTYMEKKVPRLELAAVFEKHQILFEYQVRETLHQTSKFYFMSPPHFKATCTQ